MRHTYLLGTALGAALLATPALAQPMSQGPYGGQAGSWTEQDRRDALREDRMSGHPLPSVPRQDRDAAMADQMGGRGPVGWLSQAQNEVRRGHWMAANEFVERAETRVLSRIEAAPMADQPEHTPFVKHTAAARAALAARDRDGAMREIDMAMQVARDMRGASMTGRDAGTMPMQGSGMPVRGAPMGGPAMPPYQGYGSSTMRDQGFGGSSMSRADRIAAPAAPARPVQRVQAAGGGGTPSNSMTQMQNATPQRAPTPALPGASQRGMTPAPMPGSGAATTIPGAESNGMVGGTAGVGTPGAAGGGMGVGGTGTSMGGVVGGGMGGSGMSGGGSR